MSALVRDAATGTDPARRVGEGLAGGTAPGPLQSQAGQGYSQAQEQAAARAYDPGQPLPGPDVAGGHDRAAQGGPWAEGDDASDPSGVTPAEPLPAAERLKASRERMRQWMLQKDRRAVSRERMRAAIAAGEKPALADRLRHAPVIGVVIDALSAWWSEHPLHPAFDIAQGVVSRKITPVVRRHPIPVLLGAFLVGVLLVRLRPWRWVAKPAIFAGLGSQVVTRFIASVPMDKVLALLGVLGGFQAAKAADEPNLADPDLSAEDAAAAAAAWSERASGTSTAASPSTSQTTRHPETATP